MDFEVTPAQQAAHRLPPELVKLASYLPDLDLPLPDTRPEHLDITRPFAVVRTRPDGQEAAQLVHIARLPRRVGEPHNGLPPRAVGWVTGQVWMHEARQGAVDLAQRDVVVTVPIHHLGASRLPFGSTMAPLGPPGRFLGPEVLLLAIQLLVTERLPGELQPLEPLVKPLELCLQALDLPPQRPQSILDAATQLLLGSFLLSEECPELLECQRAAAQLEFESDPF